MVPSRHRVVDHRALKCCHARPVAVVAGGVTDVVERGSNRFRLLLLYHSIFRSLCSFKKPYIVAFSQALGVGTNRLRTNTPIPVLFHDAF